MRYLLMDHKTDATFQRLLLEPKETGSLILFGNGVCWAHVSDLSDWGPDNTGVIRREPQNILMKGDEAAISDWGASRAGASTAQIDNLHPPGCYGVNLLNDERGLVLVSDDAFRM